MSYSNIFKKVVGLTAITLAATSMFSMNASAGAIDISGLYNTGVDNSGTVLGVTDTHYPAPANLGLFGLGLIGLSFAHRIKI